MGIFNFRICLKRFQNTAKKNYSYFIEQYKKDGKNLPNRITELRLTFSFIIGFLLLCLYFLPDNKILGWIIFVLFVLIAVTDILDGCLARRLHQVTKLGKILDPVTDKVLMFMVLIPILFIYGDLWPFIVAILACEMVVTGINFRKRIPVSWLGKLRMLVQCAALAFLFLPVNNLYVFKKDSIGVAMVVNFVSMASYILRAIKIGRNSDS
jgi:CDP-diacylglycerol--glycerol-3-phosphate 3-phosphatidyltransferase